ncbi:hypothetical protein M8C21_019648 [Ambrosia artemisiifolia]|uniref:TOG domain-containing protein n=1 Tax=Ambrosia artemisiifolia TaxID=4212 RepID=A0AAD5CET7_AMBAR|nr:hypothetical protein M8C21_019648 [Ambrosia artemisiifolia]
MRQLFVVRIWSVDSVVVDVYNFTLLSRCCAMMSETALRDLNLLPKSERTNETSSKDILAKPYVEPTDENVGGKQRKNVVSLTEPPVNGNEVGHSGAEVVVVEVEYIESDKLTDLEDVDESLKVLLDGLGSKDWVLLCDALNNVRRFSIYHKEALQDILDNVISLLVKALKNPRSAVCKTAIMTSADIFKAFGDSIIDSLDPLLVQLLLKSSQDKRFVCEAAEKALIDLTIWVSPVLLLPKLQPYLKNRNPRIRAKASMCVSRSVPRLGTEGIKDYGIDKLTKIASSQLSDQLPESREAARSLLLELQTAYEKSPVLAPEEDASSDQPLVYTWEQFCESNLPKLSAQAVLRVTSATREAPVSGL